MESIERGGNERGEVRRVSVLNNLPFSKMEERKIAGSIQGFSGDSSHLRLQRQCAVLKVTVALFVDLRAKRKSMAVNSLGTLHRDPPKL